MDNTKHTKGKWKRFKQEEYYILDDQDEDMFPQEDEEIIIQDTVMEAERKAIAKFVCPNSHKHTGVLAC